MDESADAGAAGAAPATCPVCGSTDLRPAGSHTPYTLFGCDRCTTRHWRPLEHPSSDFYEQEQLSLYEAFHVGREDLSDPRFERFLQDLGPAEGRKILDVGCSDGAFLELARRRGAVVVGIDIDARSVAAARRRGIEATVETIDQFVERHAPTAPGFDDVTLFDVLEHLTDPVGALRSLLRVLAPGGRLAVTVPNRNRLLADWVTSDWPPHHFFRFDELSLQETLRAAGLACGGVESFQWGYASTLALDTARRRAKALLARPRSGAAAGPSSASGTAVRKAPSRATRARRGVAHAVYAALAPSSAVLERALGRGFKLYALARRPGGGPGGG